MSVFTDYFIQQGRSPLSKSPGCLHGNRKKDHDALGGVTIMLPPCDQRPQ